MTLKPCRHRWRRKWQFGPWNLCRRCLTVARQGLRYIPADGTDPGE